MRDPVKERMDRLDGLLRSLAGRLASYSGALQAIAYTLPRDAIAREQLEQIARKLADEARL